MPVYLNPGPFDERVASAGLTMREFADIAGVSTVTISQARHGRPLRASTLRRLALGLTRIKSMKVLEDIVTATKPAKKDSALVTTIPPTNNKSAEASQAPAQGGTANDPRHPIEA